jgi:oligosaccharide repeat unit polymerase
MSLAEDSAQAMPMSAKAGGQRAASTRMPWWINPGLTLVAIVIPLAIADCLANNYLIEFNRSDYHSPIFFTWFYGSLFLGGLATIACFAFVGASRTPRASDIGFGDGALTFLFLLCMAGYVIWFGPLMLTSPDVLIGALTGEEGAVYEVRELAPTIGGVTSLVQFGIGYVCIYGMKVFVEGRAMPRRYTFFLACIFGAAVFRAAANSERIAVIELMFPLLVIVCSSGFLISNSLFRGVRQTLPLIMLGIGPVFFALFEYNRSWINHYQYQYDGLWEFALERFGLYYVTALNNFCGYLDYSSWPTFTGAWTFTWFYKLPLIGDAVQQLTGADIGEGFETFLKEYAEDEFNNPTGVLPVYHDWGVLGGLMYFALYGFIAGLAYRSFTLRRGFLQYVYPLVLFSFFEILRISYVADGRSAAAVIGLGVAYLGWGYRKTTASLATPQQAPA